MQRLKYSEIEVNNTDFLKKQFAKQRIHIDNIYCI